jgi:tetratricopeptide (TPR) repeat protein
MRDTTVNQVPEACAKLYRSGLEAMEMNKVDPAIVSFYTALEIEPGFTACREALRSAQGKAAEKKIGFWKRLFRKERLSPSLAEAEVLLHLQPLKAMSIAERVLNQEPGNIAAHRLVAKAALALELPRTALLSLDKLADEHPDHRALKLAMGDALTKSGDLSAAAALYGRLLKDNPRDGTVLRALRKLPARFVEEQANNLATGGSFAPIPATPRQNEPVPAAGDDDAIINRFEPLLEHGPRNTKILKTLAEAYARKMLFDKSLSYYRRALSIEGGEDEAIKKAISETTLKKIDAELALLDQKAPDYAERREKIENRRLEFQWQEMETIH